MVEPLTHRRPEEAGGDGRVPAGTTPDRPTLQAEQARQVIQLLDSGWLPPPGWLERFTGAAQPDRPSVHEERAVIRAAGRRIRAEGDELHQRSERARERAQQLLAETERLARPVVDQHDHRDADVDGSAAPDGWITHIQARVEARTEIYRAVGMIMLQHRCTTHDAWSILTGTSQRTNRKVRDLAGALVAHVSAGHPYPADLADLADPPRTRVGKPE